jgi:asparagine synthetase B (glutamine-hydrolysing)
MLSLPEIDSVFKHSSRVLQLSNLPHGLAQLLPKETTIQPFWALPIGDSTRYRNQRRYDDQLRALFQEAVVVRLRMDAPVLAELSGGLDSSSVVCMANHLIRRGSVGAPRLVSISYFWRNSLDEPFLRDVEAFCDNEGIHLSTAEADHPKTHGPQHLLKRVSNLDSAFLGAFVFNKWTCNCDGRQAVFYRSTLEPRLPYTGLLID